MKRLISIILLTGLVGITGCSTKPTFGERVLADGESRVALAEQWEQGKEDSIAGDKQVQKGQKLVKKGRSYLHEGEQLIASGNVAVKNNRQAYQALYQTVKGPDSGGNALLLTTKLEKFAKAWSKGEEDISAGSKLVKRGHSDISEGEAEIAKGQALMERGRTKMQQAESHYQKK
ncbi:hypothetical protein [Psychromonas sp.]|uniref:hypothetical protein n=1 Tax=Psychromonas sp. TaxID=1884585 RepID=UPI003569F87A